MSGFDRALRNVHLTQARQALPGPHYLIVLTWLHQIVRPATYVEIGVQYGDSLVTASADTRCVGIDPCPTVNKVLSPNTQVLATTSDEFFARDDVERMIGAQTWAMAFIDGLHLFEQALRDFINLERYSNADSLLVFHDCIPLNGPTSSRTRTTDFYSGDIWKLALCLTDLRPDLRLAIIPTAPTGLCVVTGLNRESTLLERTYQQCVPRYVDLDFDDYRMRRSRLPPTIANTKASLMEYLARAGTSACADRPSLLAGVDRSVSPHRHAPPPPTTPRRYR